MRINYKDKVDYSITGVLGDYMAIVIDMEDALRNPKASIGKMKHFHGKTIEEVSKAVEDYLAPFYP